MCDTLYLKNHFERSNEFAVSHPAGWWSFFNLPKLTLIQGHQKRIYIFENLCLSGILKWKLDLEKSMYLYWKSLGSSKSVSTFQYHQSLFWDPVSYFAKRDEMSKMSCTIDNINKSPRRRYRHQSELLATSLMGTKRCNLTNVGDLHCVVWLDSSIDPKTFIWFCTLEVLLNRYDFHPWI